MPPFLRLRAATVGCGLATVLESLTKTSHTPFFLLIYSYNTRNQLGIGYGRR